MNKVNALINNLSLNTVCKEANCPNRLECYSKKTATFMILGNQCTRNCRFCNVTHHEPSQIDVNEPKNVAEAVATLGLKHAVITSVTRDDLADGGASQFAAVIKEIRNIDKDIIIEVLIPDFQGNFEALKTVVDSQPDILNHNIETVPDLYDAVRPEADYIQSLELLQNVKKIDPNMATKSGIMLGLGEKENQVKQTLDDLRSYGCDFVTIGQYLQPSESHITMVEYVHPDTFDMFGRYAKDIGFTFVASSPLVRSSYKASEFWEEYLKKES